MGHVNYWLLGVAFVLGLLLTFALTVRRVKREVPVSSSAKATPAGAAKSEPSTAKTAESKEEPENGEET